MSEVLFRTEPLKGGGSIGVATLNVEKTLNSLTLNMVDLLTDQLSLWEQDDAIDMVWFEGAGEKAFCAGGDIQNLYHDMVKHPGGPCPYCESFFEREYRLDYLIHTFSKPTISWGHGIVMGGGLGIASACQFRIGTEKTRIAMPEITIGLIPDAGATWTFVQMADDFANFLALTGAQINGLDAKHVGFVTDLIAHEKKSEVFAAIKESTGSADDIQAVIKSYAGSADFPESQLVKHETLIKETMSACLSSGNPVAALASKIDEFAGDSWLERAATTFKNGAPTTAQIIVEQFKRASNMTLKEMLMQELTLASQCSRHPDFVEGVRALLIDKDGSPAWKQPNLGAVPTSWIEAHFDMPWDQHPLADLDEGRKKS